MYCPQCGQQQATDSMRFCARCGFPLEGAMILLAHGGMLPRYEAAGGETKISARRKGVKQGALLFLIGVVLVPLLAIFANYAPSQIGKAFEFFAATAAVLTFVGGPLRMLFAALFEEGAPPRQFVMPPAYGPTAIPPAPVRVTALPQATATRTAGWRRPQTAEILQPPSVVTDHTTRLLEKSDPESD
jgi:zinc-ribbon domain